MAHRQAIEPKAAKATAPAAVKVLPAPAHLACLRHSSKEARSCVPPPRRHPSAQDHRVSSHSHTERRKSGRSSSVSQRGGTRRRRNWSATLARIDFPREVFSSFPLAWRHHVRTVCRQGPMPCSYATPGESPGSAACEPWRCSGAVARLIDAETCTCPTGEDSRCAP